MGYNQLRSLTVLLLVSPAAAAANEAELISDEIRGGRTDGMVDSDADWEVEIGVSELGSISYDFEKKKMSD